MEPGRFEAPITATDRGRKTASSPSLPASGRAPFFDPADFTLDGFLTLTDFEAAAVRPPLDPPVLFPEFLPAARATVSLTR